jgi:hypothetical protein
MNKGACKEIYGGMYRIWVALYFCVFFFLLLCISGSLLYQYFGWKLADLSTIVVSNATPADEPAGDDPAPEIEMIDPKNGNYLAVKDQDTQPQPGRVGEEEKAQTVSYVSPSPAYAMISQEQEAAVGENI